MFGGGVFILILALPVILPLFEIVMLMMLTFSGVSHPVGTEHMPSFGLHPVLGLMAGFIVLWYFYSFHRSRVFAWIAGALSTLLWTVAGFGMGLEMGSRHDTFANSVKAVMEGLFRHAAPPDKLWTPFGLALWFAVCSAGWHYVVAMQMRDRTQKAEKLGWGGSDLKRRAKYLFALFVFCVICWVAGNTMSGMGR